MLFSITPCVLTHNNMTSASIARLDALVYTLDEEYAAAQAARAAAIVRWNKFAGKHSRSKESSSSLAIECTAIDAADRNADLAMGKLIHFIAEYKAIAPDSIPPTLLVIVAYSHQITKMKNNDRFSRLMEDIIAHVWTCPGEYQRWCATKTQSERVDYVKGLLRDVQKKKHPGFPNVK